MPLSLATLRAVATETVQEISDDDVPSMSAAVAYYTVFSLPPLLAILVGIAGWVFGAETVVEWLMGQVGSLVGTDGSAAIRSMIENASSPGTSVGGKVIGVVALLLGASGAFGQLQKALNRAWDVAPEASGGIVAMMTKRLLSFGMVLTIVFFLLVSLAVSTALTVVGGAAESGVGAGLAGPVMHVVNLAVSLAVITGLFGALFRYVPDVDVPWGDVWVGAFVTAVLFTLGKTAIGIYLGTANPGSAFGAAGSLIVVLVWIYYSSLILLVGAEFTEVWASHTKREPAAEPAEAVHPVALPREPARYSGRTES